MENKLLVPLLIVIVVVVVVGAYYLVFQGGVAPTEQACINAGGTVRTSLCCLSTGDFPNMCLVGPCTCSLENSHNVTICDCGEGLCWDSDKSECVTIPVG